METPAPINHQEAPAFGRARAQHPTTRIAWPPLLSYVIVQATNTDSQQLENEKKQTPMIIKTLWQDQLGLSWNS